MAPGSDTQGTRRRRRPWQRALIAVNVVVVLGFLAAAGSLAYGYDKFASIPRIEIGAALSDPDDDDEAGGAENFLVVGVDSAEGLDPDDPVAASRSGIGGVRTDTMLVLRVDPASSRAALLSLPRDLFVPLGSGGKGSDRLNAAVQIGGPELLIETLQGYLGIEINHYVQVDFFGFGQLVEAIDGVPIFFPHPVRDRRSGLDVPESGCVTLDASNALGFVRSRAYQEFVDGRWRTDGSGDLGRISRQQQFIVAALRRSFERGLRNPVTLDRLIDAGLDAVTLDDTLDGDDIVSLARRFRDFEPADLDLYELPVSDDVVGGAQVLRLRSREADATLDVFRGGSGALDEASVRVRVLNGTGDPGQAAAGAAALRDVGFAIGGAGDATRLGVRVTEVRHAPEDRAAADLVRRWLAGRTRLVEDPDVELVTVVTGATWDGVSDEPAPSTSTSSTTTLPASTTTTAAGPTTSVVGTVPDEIPPGASCR